MYSRALTFFALVIGGARAVEVLEACAALTSSRAEEEDGFGRGGGGGGHHTRGHPVCHMALGYRLWKGLGTDADCAAAALHYTYAAELAMRSVCPVGGSGGDVTGGLRRRGVGTARVFEEAEEARVWEEVLLDYRVVAAVQGVRGQLSHSNSGARAVGGLDVGQERDALERWHAQAVMGLSLAIPRDLPRGRQAVARAAELGSVRALLNLGVMALYGLGGPQNASFAGEAIAEAAKRGDAHAQVALGVCHMRGDCETIPLDLAKARELLHAGVLADNAQVLNPKPINPQVPPVLSILHPTPLTVS